MKIKDYPVYANELTVTINSFSEITNVTVNYTLKHNSETPPQGHINFGNVLKAGTLTLPVELTSPLDLSKVEEWVAEQIKAQKAE